MVTPEQRYTMIQEAAYFLAKDDSFKQDPSTYWLQAEAAIDRKIGWKQ